MVTENRDTGEGDSVNEAGGHCPLVAPSFLDDLSPAHFRKLTEIHRAATQPLPPPTAPLQRLSPRLHSEEEPGAPGWSFPITLPQDGGLQMALLASTSRCNPPCGFNDAFVSTGVIVCHLFVDFLGDLLGRYWTPGTGCGNHELCGRSRGNDEGRQRHRSVFQNR